MRKLYKIYASDETEEVSIQFTIAELKVMNNVLIEETHTHSPERDKMILELEADDIVIPAIELPTTIFLLKYIYNIIAKDNLPEMLTFNSIMNKIEEKIKK